jgi:hypothetical protein
MPTPIKFVIKIVGSGSNKRVEIEDEDNSDKKGGDFRGKVLQQRVRWKTVGNSVDTFDLVFERYDGDGVVTKEPAWPFFDGKAEPPGGGTDPGSEINEDEGTVTGAKQFSARLAEPGVYKYTVKAYKGENSWVLDPAIIIDE